MTAKSRILKTTAIEREIGERARAAKLQLRFDKVVRRLTGDLKATLASVLPEGQSVVITVTAPIKYPAKTAETLENIVRDGLAHGELCKTIHGNKVRVRSVTHVATKMRKVLVFAHNTESDARLILNIAESRLLQRG
jgi:predicted phosphohydrolase